MSAIPFSKLLVKNLVYNWFKKLTDHAPVDEMIDMLNPEILEMKFPEKTLTSISDFKEWYHSVTNTFFDQVHELKMIDITIDNSKANINLIVNWQARTWNPPEAYSKWEGVYAHQSWIVQSADNNYGAVITKYHVNQFDSMEGPLKIS